MTDFEREDMELQFVMGDKFEDMSKANYNTTKETKTPDKPSRKAEEAEWHPVKPNNFIVSLAECAKTSLVYGGLSLLVWYWQISGLMDESIALPSMLVCAVMFGLGIGKCFKRGNS
jgi:hypothetical protein